MTRDSRERRHGEDGLTAECEARPNGAEGNRPDSIAHKQLIERLNELLAKATPGPWSMQNPFRWRTQDQTLGSVDVLYRPDYSEGEAEAKANAALIVEAVNALPTLLSLITERDELREVLEFYAAEKTWQANGHPQIDADTAPIVHDGGERARQALHNTTNHGEEGNG